MLLVNKDKQETSDKKWIMNKKTKGKHSYSKTQLRSGKLKLPLIKYNINKKMDRNPHLMTPEDILFFKDKNPDIK